MKLALEKSLNKALFGHKNSLSRKPSSVSNCAHRQEPSKTSTDHSTSDSVSVVQNDPHFQTKTIDTVIKNHRNLESTTPLRNSFQSLSEPRTSFDFTKHVYDIENAKSIVLLNDNSNASNASISSEKLKAIPNSCSPSMNTVETSSHESTSYNNNEIVYHGSLHRTPSLPPSAMTSSISSSSIVSSDMQGSIESSSKMSDNSSYQNSEVYSPLTDFDLDFERIVDDVENLYRDESLRTSSMSQCSKKDSLVGAKSGCFSSEPTSQPGIENMRHLDNINIDVSRNSGNYQDPSPGHICDTTPLISLKCKINNNNNYNVIPPNKETSTKIAKISHSNTSHEYLTCIESDKDTDILVENFAEVASNRALSQVTEFVIDDIIEGLLSSDNELHRNKSVSVMTPKQTDKGSTNNLESLMSGFVDEMVLEMSDKDIVHKSFGGLYRNTKVKYTDSDYQINPNESQNKTCLKSLLWKGSSHVALVQHLIKCEATRDKQSD